MGTLGRKVCGGQGLSKGAVDSSGELSLHRHVSFSVL